MGRPVDPLSQYRVKPHVINGYTYASTQPPSIDELTGRKKYHYIHWGTVDNDLRFIPGDAYIQASPAERAKLIFPDSWDMQEANKLSGAKKAGRPACETEDANRFYGDIWLMEQIAAKTSIRQDLEKVFDGNKEIVDDIMTLAFFSYVTSYSFNRVARWQRLVKVPSTRELTPATITRLTQFITEKHRMNLLRLRAERLEPGELCAVDSTTRSIYGNSLVDIRWGKNKENLPLEQTLEVVVYTLSSHLPVYYRTFPGNMPDSRSLETILLDLEHAGFHDIILVTDRGYEKIRNLEKCILKNQAMIMCTKVQQKQVLQRIEALGDFGTRPDSMTIDVETRLYHQQYEVDYEVKSTGKAVRKAEQLRLNLYFDPVRRSEELLQLDIDIQEQKASLEELQKKGAPDDEAALLKNHHYFEIRINPTTHAIEGFYLNEAKVLRARKTSGFFSIMTHKLNLSAMQTFDAYHLRDEQEKYFQQMKDQMGADRQRNWSEEGKTGRLFILYVALVIGCYMRHIWKSTDLHKRFSSSLEVLDEMRSIRCIEHTHRAKFITPFVGDQLAICNAFGFEVPVGCSPDYVSRQTLRRKRGRPRKKKVVERDL